MCRYIHYGGVGVFCDGHGDSFGFGDGPITFRTVFNFEDSHHDTHIFDIDFFEILVFISQ